MKEIDGSECLPLPHKERKDINMKKTGFRKSPAGGKGVYLAVAVSAIAVAGVAWLATNGLETEMDPLTPLESTASYETSEDTEQVAVSREDVPKTENFVVSYPAETSSQVTGSVSTPEEETEQVMEVPVESATSEEQTIVSWILPVEGAVTNPYSNGELVKSRTLGEWRTHDGVDLAAADGTPVLAAADGTVQDVRLDSRWGYLVEVAHGDVTAYYCGLAESIPVAKGQQVKQGDTLGQVGNTSVMEASEEPHLHLGMKQDGSWIDPAEKLGL